MTASTPEEHYARGMDLSKNGEYEQAARFFRKALKLDPDMLAAKYQLGVCLRHIGRNGEAISILQSLRITGSEMFDVDLELELGLALLTAGQYRRAAYLLEKFVERSGDSLSAQIALGDAFAGMNSLDRANECYRNVIQHCTDDSEIYVRAGHGCLKIGNFSLAIAAFRKAAEITPDDALIYVCIGDCYYHSHQYGQAISAYNKAIERDPCRLEAYNNLGNIYQGMLELDKALEIYKHALSINPVVAELHTNVGNVQMELGNPVQAIESYRKALECRPGYSLGHSNLAMSLLYLPDASVSEILEEHKRWARECSRPLKAVPELPNTPVARRKLKIGYLSPNFYFHPVTMFFRPMITERDPDRFEIYCYYNNRPVDDVTRNIRRQVDHWRNTVDMSDSVLEQTIRTDGLDILVDLAGHTAGNRLQVLAQRMAPVQVTYLGYPCTTGLDQVDYFITDKLVDPEGSENQYTEKLCYIPVFSCYQPGYEGMDVGPPPFIRKRGITFGSLNNPKKFHDGLIGLWSRILLGVPGSTLIMQGKGFQNKGMIEYFAVKFTRHGIERDRLIFYPPMPFDEHLKIYNDIDIALDTFPWNGHTTSCNALWMGCPVVSVWGNRHAARMAGSLLTHIGLGSLVADSREEYVDIAVQLANDPERLSELRATMRERLKSSPLCDGKTFQRNLEDAYSHMWETWCNDRCQG